ncbi:Prp19/Pso4-like-domain-containing protein [Dipodascopsis uninucleata]
MTNGLILYYLGAVFERSAIEDYIYKNSQDPLTGNSLSEDDLIEIKDPRIVESKPASSQSIPSLLQIFQTEYDSLALESFQLKKELLKAREELSKAIYYHNAAVKVAAKISKERDEAQATLDRLTKCGDKMDTEE